jgi:hypothetical protein
VSRAKKIIVRDFFFLTVYMSCFFSGVVLLPAVLAYADVNILLEAITGASTACLEAGEQKMGSHIQVATSYLH